MRASRGTMQVDDLDLESSGEVPFAERPEVSIAICERAVKPATKSRNSTRADLVSRGPPAACSWRHLLALSSSPMDTLEVGEVTDDSS